MLEQLACKKAITAVTYLLADLKMGLISKLKGELEKTRMTHFLQSHGQISGLRKLGTIVTHILKSQGQVWSLA